jgi:hypothetical protein
VAALLSVLPSGLPAYPDPPVALARLQAFRAGLHACCTRRADALVDLADALLSTQGPVASLPQLSLEPAHRRGWGSTYAALACGRIDAERLRGLLARHPLAGGQPIYAVDVTTWPRCDAECSPERGLYYHPSRHSAGQPIVAGWAFQWICQLGFARDSWTAPVDARRLHPLDDADQQAARQIRALLGRLPAGGPVPWLVFDAGYDSAQLSLDLADLPVVVLVRLRSDRCLDADPPPRPPGAGGRPRRHGAKFAFADPTTWPTPTTTHVATEQEVQVEPASTRGRRTISARPSKCEASASSAMAITVGAALSRTRADAGVRALLSTTIRSGWRVTSASRTASCGSSACWVPEPTITAPHSARSRCPSARASAEVIHLLDPSAAAIRPSSEAAHFQTMKGRSSLMPPATPSVAGRPAAWTPRVQAASRAGRFRW